MVVERLLKSHRLCTVSAIMVIPTWNRAGGLYAVLLDSCDFFFESRHARLDPGCDGRSSSIAFELVCCAVRACCHGIALSRNWIQQKYCDFLKSWYSKWCEFLSPPAFQTEPCATVCGVCPPTASQPSRYESDTPTRFCPSDNRCRDLSSLSVRTATLISIVWTN